MTFTKRCLLAAALGLGGLMASVTAQAEELDKIRMGYIADYYGTSLAAIATEKDLWAKHGLEAELSVFTNGPIQVQALNAGSLDFAYIGSGALWLPAIGKAKVIAVNALGYSDRVIAQPGITSMADLKGKKVGVPEGTSGDMLLRLSLDKAGMTLDDIEVVSMSPSTIVTAFSSGQVDAAGLWYPFVDVIKQRVPDLNELGANVDFYPEIAFPSSFIVSEAMQDQEDIIRNVNAVLKEAGDYRIDHTDEAVKITASFLNVPIGPLQTESGLAKQTPAAELEQLTREGKVDQWFDTLAGLYADFGKIEDPLPASEFYLGDLYAN